MASIVVLYDENYAQNIRNTNKKLKHNLFVNTLISDHKKGLPFSCKVIFPKINLLLVSFHSITDLKYDNKDNCSSLKEYCVRFIFIHLLIYLGYEIFHK